MLEEKGTVSGAVPLHQSYLLTVSCNTETLQGPCSQDLPRDLQLLGPFLVAGHPISRLHNSGNEQLKLVTSQWVARLCFTQQQIQYQRISLEKVGFMANPQPGVVQERNPWTAMCALNVDVHVSYSSHINAQFATFFSDLQAKGSEPAFAWRKESHFGKIVLSTPDLDLNLDLPVIGNLVHCKRSVSDHAATEAVQYNASGQQMIFQVRAHRFHDACKQWLAAEVMGALTNRSPLLRELLRGAYCCHAARSLPALFTPDQTIGPEIRECNDIHPTEIRTSISPSSAVELNTTSALANYTTEAGLQFLDSLLD
uniref:Uncharacterized protein n=1 Tax=Timema genevievae TaxID=629358 RepID=A0A7R9JU91_TIMGE|nr:unnamed protein product [Timema genevievae]